MYNAELFWLFRVIYSRYLSKLPASSSRIHPRPPRLVAETSALFDTGLHDEVKDGMEENTTASSLAKASNGVVVKVALSNAFNLGYQPNKNDREFSDQLRAFGIDGQSSGTTRVLTYKYPDMVRRKGVKLNSELRAEAADRGVSHDDE
jgi:hypothetical protein